MEGTLLQALIVIPILMVSAILHEIGHGLAAEWLGDPTARLRGRITLNPLPHIDWFMTIALPLSLALMNSPVLFGGAKPIPVDPRNLKRPRQDMGLVAIAGPIVNFSIALLCLSSSYVLYWAIGKELWLIALIIELLNVTVIINVVLATFNLLPVPPLDGGRVAVALLPLRFARLLARIEPIGLFVVAALLLSGVVGNLLTPLLEILIRWLP